MEVENTKRNVHRASYIRDTKEHELQRQIKELGQQTAFVDWPRMKEMIKNHQIAGAEAKDSSKDVEIMLVLQHAAENALEIYDAKRKLRPPSYLLHLDQKNETPKATEPGQDDLSRNAHQGLFIPTKWNADERPAPATDKVGSMTSKQESDSFLRTTTDKAHLFLTPYSALRPEEAIKLRKPSKSPSSTKSPSSF